MWQNKQDILSLERLAPSGIQWVPHATGQALGPGRSSGPEHHCLAADPAPLGDGSWHSLLPEVRWQKHIACILAKGTAPHVGPEQRQEGGRTLCAVHFCLDNTDFCICHALSKSTEWLTRTHWISFLLWLRSQKLTTTCPVTKLQVLQGYQAEPLRSEELCFSWEREAQEFFCQKDWDLCKGRDCCTVFHLSTDYSKSYNIAKVYAGVCGPPRPEPHDSNPEHETMYDLRPQRDSLSLALLLLVPKPGESV